MESFNLEQVREKVTLIGYAIEEVDSLTKNIVEARWKFEMVKRKPELGAMRHPQTGQVVQTIGADMFAKNVETLTEERSIAIEALLDLTGADSVDSARVSYLKLVTAYQRLGSLRELQNMVDAGFQKAREEAAQQDIVNSAEFAAKIEEAIKTVQAVDAAIQIAAIEVPQIITAPKTSMILP